MWPLGCYSAFRVRWLRCVTEQIVREVPQRWYGSQVSVSTTLSSLTGNEGPTLTLGSSVLVKEKKKERKEMLMRSTVMKRVEG